MAFYNSSQGTTNIDCDDIQVVDQKVTGTLDLSDATVIWDNSILINFPVDNTTIDFNGLNQLEVKDGGITDIKTNFTNLNNALNLTTNSITCSAFTTTSSTLQVNNISNKDGFNLNLTSPNIYVDGVSYFEFDADHQNHRILNAYYDGKSIDVVGYIAASSTISTTGNIDGDIFTATTIYTDELQIASLFETPEVHPNLSVSNILNIGANSPSCTIKMVDNTDFNNNDVVNINNLQCVNLNPTNISFSGNFSANRVFTNVGASTIPSYSFTGDNTTGIYSASNGLISFADNGVNYANFDASIVQFDLGFPKKTYYFNQNGLVMSPLSNISWFYNSPLTQTGFYSSTNQIQVLTNDIVRATFNNSELDISGNLIVSGSSTLQNFSGQGANIVNLNVSTQSTLFDLRVTNQCIAPSFFSSTDGSAQFPSFGYLNDGGLGMFRGGSDILAFATNNQQRVTINASGHVGINTTTPDTFLNVGGGGVNGSSNLQGIGMLSNSTRNLHYAVGQGANNNVFLTWNHNSTTLSAYAHLGTYGGSNPLILNRDGGNVGIGTTSVTIPYKLNVSGRCFADAFVSNSWISVATSATNLVNVVGTAINLGGGQIGNYGNFFQITNNTRLTWVNSGVIGIFLIIGRARFNDAGGTQRGLYLALNGVAFNDNWAHPDGVGRFGLITYGVRSIAHNEWIELLGYQNSGGNLGVLNGELTMYRLA